MKINLFTFQIHSNLHNMSRFKFLGILFFAAALVASVRGLEFDDDFGSDFDSNWIWVGSDFSSIGKCKQ